MRQRLGWGRVDEAPTLFSSGPPVGSREELGAQYALYELGPVGARPVGMGMGTKGTMGGPVGKDLLEAGWCWERAAGV